MFGKTTKKLLKNGNTFLKRMETDPSRVGVENLDTSRTKDF